MPEEKDHIKHSIASRSLIHVVVYNRFHQQTTKSRKREKKQFIYEIAAATSFCLGPKSSCLVYLSTSIGQWYKSPEYQPASSKVNRGKPFLYIYRNSQLGRLLVCMVQKLTLLMKNQYNVVCQASNHVKNGSVYFYLKSYFQIASVDHPFVEEHQQIHTHFQNAPKTYLVFVVLTCPIYLVHPWWIPNQIQLYDQMYMIMSSILYGTIKQHGKVRTFIHYLISCIAKFDVSSNIYAFDPLRVNETEDMSSFSLFQTCVIDSIVRFEKFYNDTNRMSSLGLLRTSNDPYRTADSGQLHLGLGKVASEILNPSFVSGELERRMFCSIFNIKWEFFFITLVDVEDENIHVDQAWKFQYVSPENDHFEFLEQVCKHTTKIILVRDYAGRYFDVAEEEFYGKLHFGNWSVLDDDAVSSWMTERRNKTEFPSHFQEKDFFHPFLRKETRLHVIKCVDPLLSWTTDDIVVCGSNVRMNDVKLLVGESWASNFTLDDFIKRCLMPHQRKIKLVTSDTYQKFFVNPEFRAQCFNEKDNYSLFVCLVNIDRSHWIVVEIENNDLEGKTITKLQVADGLRPKYKTPTPLHSAPHFLYYAACMFNPKYECDPSHPGNATWLEDLTKQHVYDATFKLEHADSVIQQVNSHDCGVLCIMRMIMLIVCTKFRFSFNEILIPSTKIIRLKILEIYLRSVEFNEILACENRTIPKVDTLALVGAEKDGSINLITNKRATPHFKKLHHLER